jgi:hypothetical protein
MKRFFRLSAIGLWSVMTALMIVWSVAAIYYSNLPGHFVRLAGAVIFPVICGMIFFAVRPFRKAVCFFLVLFAAVVMGWVLIPPSNHRHWQPDVASLPSAEIEGNQLTVFNIRNCDYRSQTDYSVAYYDRTYDLTKLQGADLFLIYWGSPLIAHTMMSFCFEGDRYLCISIETRKEEGEGYSAVKGFFKQFELIYVVGDERDLVRLRTNFRNETVYLYRLAAKPELVQEVLFSYLRRINQLKRKPEWYNALTQNCTTAIRGHTAPYAHGAMSWKIIVNGYLDTLLYERKAIDTTMTFEQIKAASCINEKALEAGDSDDFSSQIRRDLPNPRR